MAITAEVVTGTTPTSTGTQSYEVSGFGTPQAAIVEISRANSTNNPETHAAISYGFADGTRQNCTSIFSEDNVTTTDTRRNGSNTALCRIINTTGGNALLGVFSAWATNGLTINFTTVDTVAYNITVTLIKGCTNIRADFGAFSSAGVNDITTVGFKGNLLLTHSAANSVTSTSGHATISIGAAHNSSTDTVSQGVHGFGSQTAQADDKTYLITRNDACVIQLFADAESYRGSAQDFDSSGFSFNFNNSPGGDYIGYLIMDTGDTDGVSVSIEDSPTSTGTWSVSTPGWATQWNMIVCNTCTTINTIVTADPVGFGISTFDATTESFIGLDHDDLAATTDTQSNSSTANAVQLYKWGGSSHDKMFEGSVSNLNSPGYSLSFPTTVDGTARKWLSVSIKSAAAPAGRIMGGLAGQGGLAGAGGIAGIRGGLAG